VFFQSYLVGFQILHLAGSVQLASLPIDIRLGVFNSPYFTPSQRLIAHVKTTIG